LLKKGVRRPPLYYRTYCTIKYISPAVVDLADGIAEQWQGANEELLTIPTLAAKETKEPLKYFKETLKWIESYRYKAFDKDDSSIQNDVDTVVKLFRSTIYKLRFLK